MKLSKLNAIVGVILAALLTLPAWANAGANTALPGTLNYIEGQANIADQPLNSKSVGSTELLPGQSLNTENGKSEVLLIPGVFLRLGDNSSVKMISPDLTNTEIELDRGQAMVEVDQIHNENNIRIRQNGAETRLLKTGLYEFDSSQKQVRVFDGKAQVRDGDQQITLKGGHQITLGAEKLRASKFDKKAAREGDLYRWSTLRSSYLAEANVDAARTYVADGWYGPGWIGAGWYWDPFFSSFTFIPANGVLYSPFGWGFYSPLWAFDAPVFVGHRFHRFGPGYRYVHVRPPTRRFGGRPEFHGGGFHPGGFHGSVLAGRH